MCPGGKEEGKKNRGDFRERYGRKRVGAGRFFQVGSKRPRLSPGK